MNCNGKPPCWRDDCERCTPTKTSPAGETPPPSDLGVRTSRTGPVEINFNPPTDAERALADLERQSDHLLDLQRYAAKMHRAKYLACLEEGFTEAQALELCKSTRL